MIRNRCTVYLRIATQYVHNKMIKSIDILKSGKLNYDDYTMMHLYIYIIIIVCLVVDTMQQVETFQLGNGKNHCNGKYGQKYVDVFSSI